MFSSLKEAKEVLRDNYLNKELRKDNWSPYKTFVHCSQTIDYAIDGYPKNKPIFIQNTIGKIVIQKFLKQGFMKHDLKAPVPGAPEINENGDTQEGLHKLFLSIDRFNEYKGKLKRHLIFGKLDKEKYDKYFCMHIEDHLSEFTNIIDK